jgi:hypothetical protein
VVGLQTTRPLGYLLTSPRPAPRIRASPDHSGLPRRQSFARVLAPFPERPGPVSRFCLRLFSGFRRSSQVWTARRSFLGERRPCRGQWASCAGSEEPRSCLAVFLLHLDCSAPEVTKGGGKPRLPRLGCDKEPSAHRADLAEDRVVVLKALITRVVVGSAPGTSTPSSPREQASLLHVSAGPTARIPPLRRLSERSHSYRGDAANGKGVAPFTPATSAQEPRRSAGRMFAG